MKYPEERFLFTVKEAAHACGVSRATLLRMEESGFLTPYRVDPDTGYRYYDADNLAQIGQYQLLQDLGLSRKEMTDIYLQKTDIRSFLAEQQQKLNRLQRLLYELEMKYDSAAAPVFTFTELPEIICYCNRTLDKDFMVTGETVFYDEYQKMIKEGFQVDGREPLFVVMSQDLSEATICIPIIYSGPSDPRIRTFPACHAFSMTGHGDYDTVTALMQRTWEEIKTRSLKPVGPSRIIALMAPYVNEALSPSEFCFEYAVPVEK